MVNRVVFTYAWVLLLLVACGAADKKGTDSCAWEMQPVSGKCDTLFVDTMDVKNPFITYDRQTDSYYMTGDGGNVWVSSDLVIWTGVYAVLMHDTASWVGATPVIKSPEIHKFADKYYYTANFEASGYCSCATFVADNITGPYRSIDGGNFLLDENEKAAYPTFCSDVFGAGYMVYSNLGGENGGAAVQIVLYNNDFRCRLGEAFVMLEPKSVPWLQKNGAAPAIESPYVFNTGDDGLGMLFVANNGDCRAVGVAYSESGTLNGPWVVEDEALLKDVETVSMFNDYDGSPVMVVAKDTVMNGRTITVPKLVRTDLQFEKIRIKGYYKF